MEAPRLVVSGKVRPHYVYGNLVNDSSGSHTDTFVPDLLEGGRRWRCRLPGTWKPQAAYQPNRNLYDSVRIVAELLRGAPGFSSPAVYRLQAMYLEFDNSGSPITPPADASIERDAARSYFNGLADHLTRDYLRVPLSGLTLTSSDTTKYPNGNVLTAYARTSGVAGVHGKPFSDAADSRVIGGALVATPTYDDATQDLLYSRFYFAEAKQIVKLPNSQIGVDWPLTLDLG